MSIAGAAPDPTQIAPQQPQPPLQQPLQQQPLQIAPASPTPVATAQPAAPPPTSPPTSPTPTAQPAIPPPSVMPAAGGTGPTLYGSTPTPPAPNAPSAIPSGLIPPSPASQPIAPANTNDPMAFAPSAPVSGPYSGSPLYAPGGAFAGQGYNGANTLAGLPSPSNTASDLPASPPPTSQTPTAQPAGPTTTPPASSPTSPNLPAGFTLGDPASANWGTAYYNGQRVMGMGANGIELEDGTIIPNTNAQQFQQLENAENANYLTPQSQIYQMQQAAQQPNTLPSIGSLLGNSEYENLVANQAPGTNTGTLYGEMSPQLQQLFQQSPLYGAAYGELSQTPGFSGPTPSVYPSQTPDPLSGTSSAPPSSSPTPAPTGGASNNFTTYNPMTIAGAGAPSSSPSGSTPTPSATGSDLGQFLSNVGGQNPTATSATPGAPGGGNFAPNLGYTTSPTDPNNPLTNQTITPTGTDFMSQAQQLLQSINTANDQQYQANLRDANRYAAGNGQLYSGIENTSLGDIAAQHTAQQNELGNQLLYGALGQQNANQYANVGIAQQQQGFQNQQQQEAFNQAMQQLLVGSQGDPAQLEMVLSSIFGSQGGNAANAAAQYMGNQQAANNSQNSYSQLLNFLNSMNTGNGGGTPFTGNMNPGDTSYEGP